MRILALTFLSLLLVAIICTQTVHSELNPPPKEKAIVLVQQINLTENSYRLLVPAKVEAKIASLVLAESEGFLTLIKKPLGSAVKSGEVVLYIENKDPAFTIAKVPVRAPIAGVISQMHSSLMSRVNRGDRLFTVVDPKKLKVTAEIPGSEQSFLKPGTLGMFKLSPDDKGSIPIRMHGISPLVDARTGTASAELEFVPGKSVTSALPSIGLVGQILFEINTGKVLLIPENSLGYSDGKPVVKIMDASGKVHKKVVELGEQKESQLVITKGLEPGEKLIVRANRTLKEGDEVEIEKNEK